MRSPRLTAECLGTALLLFVIVGSGIRAGQSGMHAHAVVVGLALGVLIALFVSVSGAHFNPVVTFALWRRRSVGGPLAMGYVAAQLIGGVIGVVLAHASFGASLVSSSTVGPTGVGPLVAEVIGTAILVLLVLVLTELGRVTWIPASVGAWVAVMVFASSSGGFLNPAVTIARSLTDSDTGVAIASVPALVAAQVVGSLVALVLMSYVLFNPNQKESHASHTHP